MVQVEVDASDFMNWLEERKIVLAEGLRKSIINIMEIEGLFKTGWTIGHLEAVVEEDGIAVIGPGVPLFYLEWGTTAHVVKPVNKKALHWKDGGKDMFSKGHIVSGIPPYAPFRRGMDAFLASLQGAFK